MAFPASQPSFSNPTPTTKMGTATSALKHATQHGQANDEIENICTFLGTTGAHKVPVKLAEAVLGGTQASISFTSIPAGYRDLRLSWTFRTNAGSAASFLGRFNNDTGNNYTYEVGSAAGTTASAFTGAAQSSAYLGECTRTASGANEATHGFIDVPGYAGTTFFKQLMGRHARGAETYMTAGQWHSTSAINRIDLFPSTGSFIAGSIFTLWGIPT